MGVERKNVLMSSGRNVDRDSLRKRIPVRPSNSGGAVAMRIVCAIGLLVWAVAQSNVYAQAPSGGQIKGAKVPLGFGVSGGFEIPKSGIRDKGAKVPLGFGVSGGAAVAPSAGKNKGAKVPRPQKNVSELVKALNDDDRDVRLATVFALSEMGPLAISAKPTLQKLAQTDPYDKVRAMAGVAISQANRR